VNAQTLLLSSSKLLPNTFDPLIGIRCKSLQLAAVEEIDPESVKFDLAAWFNPNTRGGVIVWGLILVSFPITIYYYFVGNGVEETRVGAYIGAAFVLISMLAWASSYIFRVANKDMTYAKQLRDYENAVLQKRLEELADDEIEALMEEIDKEDSIKKRPNTVVEQ